MSRTSDIAAVFGDDEVAPARKGSWTDLSPHPWRRLGARLLDLQIFAAVGFFLAGVVLYLVDPDLVDRLFGEGASPLVSLLMSWLAAAVAVPFNALSIGLTGGSIGKWLFGVRVVNREGRPIGLIRALMRELRVLVMGLGLNLPIITLFAMFSARGDLEDRGDTAWDVIQDNVVRHRPMGVAQALLGTIGAAAVIGAIGYGWAMRIIAAMQGH